MPLCTSPGNFTDYVEYNILSHILGVGSWTPPANLEAALGSGSGSFEAGTFNELSGKGYARRKIVFVDPPTTDDGVTFTVSKYKVVFGPATEDWAIVSSLAIYDADGGEMLTWAPLETNWSIKQGQQFVFDPGDIKAGLTQYDFPGRWSPYLREKVIKHVYLNIAYTPPTIYAALSATWPGEEDTGSDLVEPVGGYSRVLVNGWSEPAPYIYQDSHDSSVDPRTSFGTATSNWFSGQAASNVVFVDAATGGNLLFWGSSSIDQVINAGDTALLGESHCGVW